MRPAIIVFFILVSFSGFTATRGSDSPVNQPMVSDTLMIWEKLNIQCDPRINELLKQQVNQGKLSGTTSGYRLQIYFGSGENAHSQALRIKTEFLSSNPDVKTYILFKSPDFIVRVGNFRTKSEALKMEKTLLYKFPNAFIVADEIAYPQLINSTTTN